jgi:hypothetical protein
MRVGSLVGAPTIAAAVAFFLVPATCRLHAGAARDRFTGSLGQKVREGRGKSGSSVLVGAPTERGLCSGQTVEWSVCAMAGIRVSERAGRSEVRALHVSRPNNIGAPRFSFWNWSEVAG